MGPVITECTRVVVDKREALHRGARPGGGREQPLEILEPLTPPGRALEFRRIRGHRHLLNHPVERLDGSAFEEGHGGLHSMMVLRLGNQSGARTGAEVELMAHARGPSRSLEEIGLVAEDDRHGGRTVAQTEQVVERAYRLADPAGRGVGAVATGPVPWGSAARQPGSRSPGDADEGGPAHPVHLMIEWGTELRNLAQLSQVSRELAWDIVPGDVGRCLQYAGGLVLGIPGSEIGEQPSAEALGLAHVDHPPNRIHHPVHSRPILGQPAYSGAQCAEVGSGEGEGGGVGQREGEKGKRGKGKGRKM